MGLWGRVKKHMKAPIISVTIGALHTIRYRSIPLAGRVFAALVANGTGSLTCRLAGSLALAASALLHGIL